ncbi:MAG: PD-(D/E)XK nuclease family protein, partial [Agathobacter sp.]|nr:PD-(D/E)XK nuclease family protein [Agathobacter sp.]
EGEVEIPEFLMNEREVHVTLAAGENLGALRGTAVHRIMECLDFKKLLAIDMTSRKEVWEFLDLEIARMLEKKLLTEEMERLIYRNSIIDFLMTPIALRMAQADARGDLYKEKPFVMDYEGVLLQGIIDVFWLEGGKIVLMDYKTDRVKAAEELIARYATQLELYAEALCKVFSTKDRQIEKTDNLIYSFALNDTISVNILHDAKKTNII